MAGSFRSSVWDPSLIIAQILCMQSTFYIFLGIWVIVLDLILQSNLSLSQLYSFESLQFRSGKLVLCAYTLNAITGALSLWYIVKRTKQCLDFTVTVFLIHLVVCCIYNGRIPVSIAWWLTNVVVIVIMTVLGEFLCMKTEMKEIPRSAAMRADL